jgi:hypothetical protein
MKKLSLAILSISSMIYATPKATLHNNSTLTYHDTPQDVTTLSDIFTQGSFYGRLRFNSSAFITPPMNNLNFCESEKW